jgi:hypothetical protein
MKRLLLNGKLSTSSGPVAAMADATETKGAGALVDKDDDSGVRLEYELELNAPVETDREGG